MLIENVLGFPVEFLAGYLSDYYTFSDGIFRNTEYGIPCRRDRRYIFMHLKCVCRISRPLSDMNTMWQRNRAPKYTWVNFLFAEEQELRSEVNWARSRSDPADPIHCSDSLQRDTPLTSAEYRQSLSSSEHKRLSAFSENYDVEGCVLPLAQDPDYCRAASSNQVATTYATACYCPTIITTTTTTTTHLRYH